MDIWEKVKLCHFLPDWLNLTQAISRPVPFLCEFCVRIFWCQICGLLLSLVCSVTFAEPTAARFLQPFIKTYCVACHGPEKQEGKLRLDTLATDFSQAEVARQWVEVMDQLNRGEMPPDDRPRPDTVAQQQIVKWIAAELRAAERQSRSSGGRVVLRRMNRTEYANTIRDLLAIHFLPGESPLDFLPPDGRADGFDKGSSALMLDPSLLDKYYEVAQRIAAQAIVIGPPPFATYRNRFELEDTAKRGSIRYMCAQPGFQCREHDVVVMEGGTRSFDDLFYPGTKQNGGRGKRIPIKGMYAVRVRAAADRGGKDEPVTMQVVREGGGEGVLLETIVDAPEAEPKVYEVIMPLGTDGGEFSVRIGKQTRFRGYSQAYGHMERAIEKAGNDQNFGEIMRIRGRMLAEGIVSGSMPNPEVLDLKAVPKLFVDWIEIEGPLYEQWPPRSHDIVMGTAKDAAQDVQRVRAIFTRFLPRAFRRPVAEQEVEPFVKLVQQELDSGAKFEEAIRVGLAAVLTSPKFIYLFEPSSESRRGLNDDELASRLSYFLWSSLPDERLFELAAAGKLNEPKTLAAEVERMLKHDRSSALVNGFGAQWLRTDEFRNFKPDEKLYTAYNDKLGAAMVQQSLGFFEHVLRSDLPVTSFLDSDFTLINERLARFYGIDGVEGEAFRVVKLPADSPRGGLLGQAGVMLRGSDGNRTKPVTRGVYVREVLFNDPPDPPPPNVGEIEPNIQGKNLTVRDRLLQHQQIEACAACHRSIDPYGLALENFNVIGQWRDQQDGENFRGGQRPKIDASSKLPNGDEFTTFAEFKSLLKQQHPRFRQALAEKLLSYALGRPVEPLDRPTIDQMTTAAVASDDSLRSLIQALVASEAFRTK
jgi:cytochrome c553